jgi:uncharacterized membrane protein YphA (DoxX/SURF4 family)
MDDDVLLALVGGTSFALGLPFMIGAVAKLRDPGRFVSIIREYQLVPEQLLAVAAGGIIAAELGLAILLVSGIATAVVALSAALLSLVFLGAVLINLRRRRAIACGCFGDDERISGRTVLRLLTMTGAAIVTSLGALIAPETSALTDPSPFVGRAAIGIPIALFGWWLITLPQVADLADLQLKRRPVPSDASEAQVAR